MEGRALRSSSEPDSRAASATPPARILIVEDDWVVARDIAQQMQRCGHNVIGQVATGEDALALAARDKPSLVLMDIRLEGALDGIDAARQLRAAHDVPVVFLTAYADEDTVRRATLTEPFGYVLKPFDDLQLRTVVEMALYKHDAERRLRESEQRYAVTLASIGDGVIATDTDGRITLMNPVAERLTGWRGDAAAGRPLADVLALVDEDTNAPIAVSVAFALLAGGNVPYPARTRLVERSGRTLPVEIRSSPIVSDAGSVCGMVFAIRDATESRHASQAAILRETNERLGVAMRGSKVGVWDVEIPRTRVRAPRLQCWNISAWLGYAERDAELDSIRVLELVHEDDRALLRRAFARCAARPGSGFEIEHRVRKRDGSYRWVLTRGTSTALAGQGGTRVSGTAADITERKALEETVRVARDDAETANRAKDQFLANISHELRTPLNCILGYSQILRHDASLAERAKSHIALIEQSGSHLLTLINDLLDFARVGAGRVPLDIGDVLLAPFVETLSDMVYLRAREKGLEQTCALAPDAPRVIRADEKRLRQVLLNLLSNAVKFTDLGSVHFSVNLVDRHVLRFEVRDTGVGIHADQLERVFQPFEQAGDSERQRAGLGLGLSISQHLAKRMSSAIEVESVPGRGSRFWLDFAVESGAERAEGAPAHEPADDGWRSAADVQSSSAAPGNSPAPFVSFALPSRADMEALHALALRGSMSDVVRHVQGWCESPNDHRYRVFAEQVRTLAQNFESRQLLALIEKHLNET
ncbi:PAS domain S-box protein [Paraburkholderia sp. Ac-20347]|nr:PAS domain S-box protein [Paraburkholderia sp. Ac-20347]